MIISRCDEDRKDKPGWLRMGINYANASAKHIKAGSPKVSLTVLKQREDICWLCPDRTMDACSACGCPLSKKLPWATEQCGRAKHNLKPLLWDAITDPKDIQ